MPAKFHPGLKHKQLTLFPLVLTLFCLVSGGPHGLESAIMLSGPGMGLLLVLLLPIIYALPSALMTAELTAAIPEEGGYYEWARRALGEFWGFQAGWWTWLYSMADAAIYPVLFTGYLSSLFKLWSPNWDPLDRDIPATLPARLAVAFLVIAVFTWMNVRGTKLVGRTSVVLGLFLIAPFVAMAVVGLLRWAHEPGPLVTEFIPKGSSVREVFATGLYVVMWNYLGWDTLSTVAEEVDRPEKTFPRALLICVPLVTLVYVMPVLVGLRFFPDYSQWKDETWPLIAKAVGGQWLGTWVNFAGLASPIALFVTAVLGASRIPFVLAEERYFPKQMLAIHPRFGTPHRAIWFCGAIYVLLASYMNFQQLVELNVTLYSAALIPELIALVVLRYKEPNMPRPYKIPWGWFGVWATAILPIVVSVVAFIASWNDPDEGWRDQIPVLCLLASGPIIFFATHVWRRTTASASPR